MPPRSQEASAEGIESFQLPKALVTRIAKSALSHDAKLQKDTVSALVDGATVFINYLAATAQDVAASCSRKTIAGPDVLKALEIIEFGDLVPQLQSELDVYHGGGKTDKGKGKGIDVKGKGKQRGEVSDAFIPQPGISFPAVATSPREDEPEDGSEVLLDNVDEAEEEDLDEDEDIAEAEDGEEDPEGDAADEPGEIIDTVAMEEEELRKDQHALEEGVLHTGEEDIAA